VIASLPSRSVLDRFGPSLGGLRWTAVSGGFSGAAVWRGETSEPLFALKAWPEEFTPARLTRIHAWMARAAHLPFVPQVIPTSDGDTLASEAGRVWDVTRWMSGTPSENPSVADVGAACAAAARLHAAWPPSHEPAPCPGVINRLRVLREWITSPAPQPPSDRPLATLVRRAWDAAKIAAPAAACELLPWATVPLRVQPCVRDLRAAHILFLEDAVCGIIDYGAMAEDYPAVDLARLLGEWAAVTGDWVFDAGLRAYRDATGVLDVPDEFVRVLDRSGAVCSVIGWLRRLARAAEPLPDATAVAARLGRLVARVEVFTGR
jgi:homoserine kinase type II